MTNEDLARLRANNDKGFRPTRAEASRFLDELEQARAERDAARAAVVKLGDSARKTIDDLDAAYALLRDIDEGLIGWPSLIRLRDRIEAMVGEK